MIRAIAMIAFGLACIAFGLYLYLAPGAERRIRRSLVLRTGLVPSKGLWGEIPLGAAFACAGFDMLFRRSALHDLIVIVAVVLFVVALIAMLWAPNWIRPKWARSNTHEHSASTTKT